jgi:hypothetical protein
VLVQIYFLFHVRLWFLESHLYFGWLFESAFVWLVFNLLKPSGRYTSHPWHPQNALTAFVYTNPFQHCVAKGMNAHHLDFPDFYGDTGDIGIIGFSYL